MKDLDPAFVRAVLEEACPFLPFPIDDTPEEAERVRKSGMACLDRAGQIIERLKAELNIT